LAGALSDGGACQTPVDCMPIVDNRKTHADAESVRSQVA
jgi:hypothetical protein